jgi:hypothetical protein
MPKLTRRCYSERPDCWHVYYGDVNVGTIARRVGQPHDEDPWEWLCGFYPGSEPGEQTNGTGASFQEAREGFEEAWRTFSARRTPADYQAWRDRGEICQVGSRQTDAVANDDQWTMAHRPIEFGSGLS